MAPEEAGLPWANVLYCYFISIAAVIGTGILAIPVKLFDTGFLPFVALFTVSQRPRTARAHCSFRHRFSRNWR